MDHALPTAFISAAAALIGGIVVAIANYRLSVRREHEADWRKLKFDRYQEFIIALSGVVQGRETRDAKLRYADAVNSMSLVAPEGVLHALQQFQDEITYLNQNRSQTKHDELLNILLRQMRADIRPGSRANETIEFKLLAAPPDNET
jgi:hypothetical protein